MILVLILAREMTGKGSFIHTGTKQNKMQTTTKVNPTIIIILGATGDLTWRKLIPAIYNLYLDKRIPEKFVMLGVGHTDMSDNQFRNHLHEGVDEFSRRGKSKKKDWETFAKCLSYSKGEFSDNSTYDNVEKQIKKIEK